GQEDITNRRIRTVGHPEDRFREDPLRMMRAIRFVSQLSFELESKTYQAIVSLSQELSYISTERIRDEFEKLLLGQQTTEALTCFVLTGLYLECPTKTTTSSNLHDLAALNISYLRSLTEKWAGVCIVLQIEDFRHWLKSWKLSNQFVKTTVFLIQGFYKLLDNPWHIEDVYEYGEEHSHAIERLRVLINSHETKAEHSKIHELFHQLPIKRRSELAVNGNDLIKWHNKKSGVWISIELHNIEQAIIHQEIPNKKESIHEWLK